MNCTHCNSENTRKNGHTHYNKQNHLCNDCKRQFVAGGQAWFVSESERVLINKLLLERISLLGICRVCDISESWLLRYIKELYADLPDDLNATLTLPEEGTYLSNRFEEEIKRIVKKKDQNYLNHIQK